MTNKGESYSWVIPAKIILVMIYIIISVIFLCLYKTKGHQEVYYSIRGILFSFIGFFMLVIKISIHSIYDNNPDPKNIKHIRNYLLYYPILIMFTGLGSYLIATGILNDSDFFIKKVSIAVIAFFLGLRIDGLYNIIIRNK